MPATTLPLRLKLLRLLAGGFAWLPAALVVAALVVGLIAATSGRLGVVWVEVLVSALGAVGFSSLLLSAWQRGRIRLFEYQHAGEPRREHDGGSSHRGPSRDYFEQLVEEALDEIPHGLRAQMANVSVLVEDEPPPEQRLLGLYQGIPLTRRSHWYSGALPDRITIYRGPIERACGRDPVRLAREVRRTVLHEVAHHFGISDERLLELDRY